MSRPPAILPHEIAVLSEGLLAEQGSAEWSLATRLVERLQGRAVASMSDEQARAWMALVTAPIALRASRGQVAVLEQRVAELESQLAGVGA